MKCVQRKILTSARLLLAVVFLATSNALAQSGDGYDLSWSALDGGGGQSCCGTYRLEGAIGYPDAGVMTGGFWGPVGQYKVFLPLILRG
ncbi:MAG: hypothetical protein JXA21_01500 [Anaerolineae bacterium]|nr:hypothetical protein [Anaerolineae bacterium]